MFKTLKGFAIISCVLGMAMLVGCVGELNGNSKTKLGFCTESGETGENASCDSDGDCETGLRCYGQGGSQFCVVPCGGNDDCGNGVCNIPEGDDNNASNNTSNNSIAPNNNTDNNNVAPNNNTDNNNVAPNNNNNVTPNNNVAPNNGDLQACADACDKLVDCLADICAQPVIDPDTCAASCANNPAQADQILATACPDINASLCAQEPQINQLCECPTADTNVGDSCASDAECEADGLDPFCFPATNPENGNPTGWEGGYCSSFGCQSDAACGAGNLCVQIDQQGTTVCFAGCNNSNCREDYACQDLSGGQQAGVNACVPACGSNEDCGAGGTCNPDGTCS